MQGIYTHITETNYVPREYSVAAIMLLLFMVLILLVPVLNLLYFYISTFRSTCAFVFTFHMRCASIVRSLYITIFWASFLITLLFSVIITAIIIRKLKLQISL